MFIYQKIIDRSTLWEGFQIPADFRRSIVLSPGGLPSFGETYNIKVVVGGKMFDAQLKNQHFDRNVYNDHSDVIQIRYTRQSAIAKKLREIFSVSFEYVERIKALPENRGRKITIRVPEEQQEAIIIRSTDIPNVYIFDCVTTDEKLAIKEDVRQMPELYFETFEPREDSSASIEEMTRIQRVRHIDRSIGDSLKQLYDYRCQMTGIRIGEQYGALCVEAHHIVPFTKSINNDTSNIIVISPTYHRIIHKANPVFDRSTMSFNFPNGLVEKVKLNWHLPDDKGKIPSRRQSL